MNKNRNTILLRIATLSFETEKLFLKQ